MDLRRLEQLGQVVKGVQGRAQARPIDLGFGEGVGQSGERVEVAEVDFLVRVGALVGFEVFAGFPQVVAEIVEKQPVEIGIAGFNDPREAGPDLPEGKFGDGKGNVQGHHDTPPFETREERTFRGVCGARDLGCVEGETRQRELCAWQSSNREVKRIGAPLGDSFASLTATHRVLWEARPVEGEFIPSALEASSGTFEHASLFLTMPIFPYAKNSSLALIGWPRVISSNVRSRLSEFRKPPLERW